MLFGEVVNYTARVRCSLAVFVGFSLLSVVIDVVRRDLVNVGRRLGFSSRFKVRIWV
jgi:hypothetical protein